MNAKRSHTEATLVHPSRQHQVPVDQPRSVKKHRTGSATPQKKQVHASSVNTIKKNVRSVTRRLEKFEDLPANVRVDEERRLAAIQADLAAAETLKFKYKMIKRYHMVRFFERRKATRHLKKQQKQLLAAQSPEEIEAAKKRVHIAEVDLIYTQYCPLSEPYIGIYAQKSKGENGEDPEPADHYDVSKKPLVWAEVERSMAEGTLDLLRNRVVMKMSFRPKPKAALPKPSPKPKVTESTNKRSSGELIDNDQPHKSRHGVKREREHEDSLVTGGAPENPGDQSDGGFFEE